MDCTASHLAYRETGYFSKLILDYLDSEKSLMPFYRHPVSLAGISEAIKAREQFPTDRKLLVHGLRKQYESITPSVFVNNNIEKLLLSNTFTITTAHQPAIFTGTLYFVYKILHTVKLAAQLSEQFPNNNFVPVYFMGSEDADLDELGHIFMSGQKLEWDTKQKGAVGRMNNKGLEKIITRIEGEISVQPFGKELILLLKESYIGSPDVQTATLKLVHALFEQYGVIVFIPDNAEFKKAMTPVFEEDLFQQTPSKIVERAIQELPEQYKAQAHPREINLFYLKDNLRGRIEKVGDRFIVHDSTISFSEQEIREELKIHPESFSPNVILRGIMQETLLPNIVFIGGGGEMAYWLELKNLFDHFKVPYPVLLLRNSFLVIEKKWSEKMHKLGLTVKDSFKPTDTLFNELVKKSSNHQLTLDNELAEAKAFYEKLKAIASKVDSSLEKHADALYAKTANRLHGFEKKLLKAEKRKFDDQQRQIQMLKSALFPLNNLQERIDNFMPFYAKWGKAFIDMLYKHSLTLKQDFIILEIA
ncbi:MAG: bacillithiol biosynthesis cysteine-adding enzyme BshC [Bacteroidetes bacterium]|nr:bacillithiol biosynthesis cysteine-adding enzyme BshC [Bacteroidota bacterium]